MIIFAVITAAGRPVSHGRHDGAYRTCSFSSNLVVLVPLLFSRDMRFMRQLGRKRSRIAKFVKPPRVMSLSFSVIFRTWCLGLNVRPGVRCGVFVRPQGSPWAAKLSSQWLLGVVPKCYPHHIMHTPCPAQRLRFESKADFQSHLARLAFLYHVVYHPGSLNTRDRGYPCRNPNIAHC